MNVIVEIALARTYSILLFVQIFYSPLVNASRPGFGVDFLLDDEESILNVYHKSEQKLRDLGHTKTKWENYWKA